MEPDNMDGLSEPLARVEHEGGEGIVFAALSGEIDLSNAAVVEEQILATGADGGLAVDLTNLTYLDSSGLAMLSRIAEKLGLDDRRMCVVVPEGVPTRRLFELVGLDDTLPVVTDREAARARLTRGAASKPA
jgi:anti-anti-sigma factor